MNVSLRLLALLSFLSCLIPPASSISGEDPRLVIDPQGHAGLIRGTVFSPDGATMISVGTDKTIRLWDFASGKLKQTLRTHLGDAEDGKHFACALSPEGRLLAVGGWASAENDDYGAISVIDLSSGKLAALLRGHTDVVHSLDFSSDGQFLLSGSSDATARVWDLAALPTTPNETAVKISKSVEIAGHENKVYRARFIGDSDHVITGSFDHSVRFWVRGPSGKSYTGTAVSVKHGSPVTSLEVSPDGSRAVSGDLDGKLLLWNTLNNSFSKVLDGNMEVTVGAIAFSPDSSQVIASSRSATGGKSSLYSLPDGAVLQEYALHDNSVTAAAWHPTEPLAVLAGSNGNVILAFDPASGEVKRQFSGVGAAVWNVAVSPESLTNLAIGFIPPSPNQTVQAMFDLDGLKVGGISDNVDLSQYSNAIGTVGGESLSFTSLTELKVGKRGTIFSDENSNDRMNVASYTPDGQEIIVGSSYFLRRYAKSGKQFAIDTEYRGHEGDVRMVAPSSDGKYLVSGALDQTTRIWDLESGTLLATLFVAMDGEWVLWTPQGYFAASPNGGKYIGWHFNRGLDRMADFISGDQLYDQFYRPDIVKKSISDRRSGSEIVEELGLAFDLEAAVEGAPEVAFVDPVGDGRATARRQTVLVRATDHGSGIGEVQVFHEGKRLQPDGPGAIRGGNFEVPFTVSLLSGKNEIRAVAVSPGGVESTPKVVTLEFGGVEASSRLFLLGVGLNDYQNPKFNLNYCRPDVDSFVEAIEKHSGRLFSEIIVKKLYDAEATAGGIADALTSIAATASADDVFVFAFAGHGVMSDGAKPGGGEFHIIPYDVTQMYGNDEMLAEKALSGSKLQAMAAAIPARKQLMVLDACQSGGVVESFAVRGAAEERALAQLARSTGMYVLASTRSEQFAAEAAALGHGLFTFALLEALNGKGDGNGDGKITVKEVEAWLNERVPELSEEHSGTAQYPNSFARGQDFPIGLLE